MTGRWWHSLVVLAVGLAWIGGFVDGAGYLLLQHVFVAHQSGNTASSAVAIGQGDWSRMVRRGAPIGLFVIGVALGAALLEFAARRKVRALTSLTLASELVLLVAFVLAGRLCFTRDELRTSTSAAFIGLIAILVLAMGVQTATLRKIGGRTVRTTYVTGMLTHLAEEAVDYVVERRDVRKKEAEGGRANDDEKRELAGHRHRMLVLMAIWASYAVGAIAGGFAELSWEIYAFIVPACVLAAIVGVDLRWPWHAPTEDPLHGEQQAVGLAS